MDANLRARKSGSIPALILILAGLAFCISNALGWLDTLCFTGGCRLTQDIKPFGLSLWWYGAACFAIIGLLVVLKRTREAFMVGAVALAADVFFLTWLGMAAPCFTCMLGGIFFLAVFFALFRLGTYQSRWPKVLAALWFFALAPNLFFMFHEAAPPWPLDGPPNAPVQVYFSPTCPACSRTMEYFMPDIGKSVAVYPISRNENDRKKILIMVQALEKGAHFRDAYMLSKARDLPTAKQGLTDKWKLNWRLWRNKVALIRSGVSTIPAVILHGGPAGRRASP